MFGAIGLIVGGYLLGALPFSVALAVATDLDPTVRDIHVELWRRAGVLHAGVAMLVDVLKGVFPVLVGYGFDLPIEVVALTGVAAACGQMWPPMRGHGEKGNSAGVGALLTLLMCYGAYAALLCAIFFLAGAALRLEALSRETSEWRDPNHPLSLALPLGTLLGFVSCPLLCWLSGQPQALVVGSFLLLCAIILRRLTANLAQDMSIGAKMGGVLVRRLLFDQTLVERYHDLKRANGYSYDSIERKRLSLEGVLVPVTAEWNEDLLHAAGFHHVDCVWRWMNFAAWLAVKE